MKKLTAILLSLCALLALTGCVRDNNTTSPTPTAAVDTIPSPDIIPGTTDALPGDTAMPEGDAGIGGAINDAAAGTGALTGGIINGFEEGKVVDQSEIPEVVQAIKAKYPNAQITSVSMTSHGDAQVYHVMLEGEADTKEIYVDAQGNISPYVAGTADTANTGGTDTAAQ